MGQSALTSLGNAATLLSRIRESIQMTPSVRLSTIWTRAAAGELSGSPMLRETMLSIKKTASDKFARLLAAALEGLGMEDPSLTTDLHGFQDELRSLTKDASGSGPLRSQDDVRGNEGVRTTAIAQKVLLSKHKAALSERDRAYSDLVARFHDRLERYFSSVLRLDARSLFLSEVLVYDVKSPLAEVSQPKPRFAIERALAAPRDYLGCECCGGGGGGGGQGEAEGEGEGEGILSGTQPATAILYQLYLESGALINVSDLWSAFNAIAGEGEEDESKTMYVCSTDVYFSLPLSLFPPTLCR